MLDERKTITMSERHTPQRTANDAVQNLAQREILWTTGDVVSILGAAFDRKQPCN
jgi:hypothetical protein